MGLGFRVGLPGKHRCLCQLKQPRWPHLCWHNCGHHAGAEHDKLPGSCYSQTFQDSRGLSFWGFGHFKLMALLHVWNLRCWKLLLVSFHCLGFVVFETFIICGRLTQINQFCLHRWARREPASTGYHAEASVSIGLFVSSLFKPMLKPSQHGPSISFHSWRDLSWGV